MAYELETTVLGGLPVTIEFTVAGAEPDVGIMSAYVDEWYITHINGRAVKKCDWLDKRIAETKGETDTLIEAMNEHAAESDAGYYDY